MMAGIQLDDPRDNPKGMCRRWGLSGPAILILLALLYFTPIGGTRVGTYHFPLVAFSHLLAFSLLVSWAAVRLRRGRWLPRTPLDVPLAAFYSLNVVSTLFSSDVRLSAENLAHLTIFVLLYYVVVDALLSGWKTTDLVKPTLLVAGVVILAEVLELVIWLGIWALGTGEISPLLTLGEYRRRLVMGPANVLAWYVVLILPLVLARWLTSRSRRARVNLSVLAVSAALVLASTLSRSGLIGTAVALAAFALLVLLARIRKDDLSLVSLGRNPVALAVLVLTALLATALVAAAVNLMSARFYSISVRFELWRAAADVIVGRPLFGGGPGTFGYLFHQVPDVSLQTPDTYYNNAHNGFINVAAESGLPSLAAALWLIAVLVKTAWRSVTDATSDLRDPPIVAAACVAAIVGLMASTLFDVPWVFPLTTVYVLLFSAIVVAPHSSQRTVSSRPVRWTTAFALVLLVAALAWGDGAHYFQQRAVSAVDGGRFDEAVVDLQRAVALDPHLTMYRFQLGIARAYLGFANDDPAPLDLAIRAYEEEIARGGDTPINNGNLAWLKWNAGRMEQAVELMERARDQAPRDPYYKLGLGLFLETAHDYQGAGEAYAAAVAVSPPIIESAFWQTSEYRRAFKLNLPESGSLSPLPYAWAAYFAHDFEEATRALDSLPRSATSLILRGKVEAEQGQYSLAQAALDEAISMSGTNAKAYLARGQLYLVSGDEGRALRDLRIAGLLGERGANVALGEIAYQKGDLQKAITFYRDSAPDCAALTAAYDYASQVYHRSDVSADFWPEDITCAPFDSLVPNYLQLASAYRAEGYGEKAAEVCDWLYGYYEPSYLGQLDLRNDREAACPISSARHAPRSESASSAFSATPAHPALIRTRVHQECSPPVSVCQQRVPSQ